jgi:N-acetyl-alpha-D-muramate 1-phosphate uridylyltransferase
MSCIDTAMILAAGLGTRMQPLTLTTPKPLIKAAGRALLDHALDELAPAGIGKAVVNVHHLAAQVEAHCRARQDVQISISDERALLLETGGGVRKALPHLGESFADAARMDALLLLTPRDAAIGYSRAGDFELEKDGRVRRRHSDSATYVFASIQIAHRQLFEDLPDGPVSTNIAWDAAIGRGRLYGHVFDGLWCDVGTPESLALAEAL